jgi:AcrR family transcriptional regulator
MTGAAPAPDIRSLRSDAAANRDRVLAAAVRAVLREGYGVPLSSIAEEAGVGVATLYRRFPDRSTLMNAVQARSYGLIVAMVDDVLAAESSGIDGIRGFLEGAFALRGRLVLPLHGADVSDDPAVVAGAAAVRDRIATLVERGRTDRTLHPEVTARTVVEFSALLVEGLPNTPQWEQSAAGQRWVFLRGIAA